MNDSTDNNQPESLGQAVGDELSGESKGRKRGKAKKAEKPKTHESTGRFRTGFIFSASVLACLLISRATTVIMVAVIAALCCMELCALLRSDAKLPNEWIAVVAAVLYPFSYVWMELDGCLLLTMVLVIVSLIWYVAYPLARITDVAVTVFCAIYTGLLLSSLVVVRSTLPGIWGGVMAAVVVFSVWANDTMAYVWGSRLGRHRMAPRISPNKSWEGCVAGLIGSVAIWIIMCFVPGVNLPLYAAVICGLISGSCAVLGDLTVSRIKRAAGKKDSGHALKGHGGFLDRCDALILGSATSVVCLMFFGVLIV